MDINNSDCIFCKIVRGELPSYKIYENESILAFLDIYPNTVGRTLIIPKQHFVNMFDIEKDLLIEIQLLSKEIIDNWKKKFGDLLGGVKLLQNSEAMAGQVVFHYHLHIIPFWNRENSKSIKDMTQIVAILNGEKNEFKKIVDILNINN